MITIDALRTILDSIAAAVTVFDVALGEGTPGSVSGAADTDAHLLAGIEDVSVQRDLTPTFASRAAQLRASVMHRSLSGPILQRALDRHLGRAYGSLSAFLRQHDTRVHEHLVAIGFSLDADVVFTGEAIELGTLIDGAFTDGAAVDTAQRADAGVELVVDAKGPTPAMVHVTMRTRDSASTVAAINVPGNTAAGAVLPISDGQRFADVTDMTIADGGDREDAYRVRTIVERNVTL